MNYNLLNERVMIAFAFTGGAAIGNYISAYFGYVPTSWFSNYPLVFITTLATMYLSSYINKQ